MPWRTIAAYGGLLFAGQFGLMFYAMDGLIPVGLGLLIFALAALCTLARVGRSELPAVSH